MCKDDPFNHIALHFSSYDQYHHQFRWLTFGFPATDDISHVTCLLFVFVCVPNIGCSQQIKFLKLNQRVSNITNVCDFVDLYRGSSCIRNIIFTLIPSNGNVYPLSPPLNIH